MQNTSGPFKRFLTPTRGPWGPAGLPGAAGPRSPYQFPLTEDVWNITLHCKVNCRPGASGHVSHHVFRMFPLAFCILHVV